MKADVYVFVVSLRLDILHQRFAQNSRGSFQKINKQIIFPLELDLSPFVLSASSHSEANTSPLGELHNLFEPGHRS